MARVVPSQVVGLIDELFPEYSGNSRERPQHYNRTLDRSYGLQAILDLTDQIPSTLLVLDNYDYSVLVCCDPQCSTESCVFGPRAWI
jgi:hypothetical protein